MTRTTQAILVLTSLSLTMLGGCARRRHVQAQYPQAYVQQQYAQPQYAQPQYAQPQYAQPQYAQPAPRVSVTAAPRGYVQPGVTARVRVTVAPTAPPPAPAVVVQQPPPRQNAVWVPGHWQWSGQQYQWAQGRYIDSMPGRVYVQPRWQRRSRGWVYSHGHWGGHHGHGGHYGHGGHHGGHH